MEKPNSNIYPEFDKILIRANKEKLLNQKGIVIWFTGLSGSGKSTISIEVERLLHSKGYLTQILDGDKIRNGINNNLGFSVEDRFENIRRIAEVSKLFVECGLITICSFISPTEKIRSVARSIIGNRDFVEIYTNTPLEVCEERDVKGLYKKARAGLIKDFSGITSPNSQLLTSNFSLLSPHMLSLAISIHTHFQQLFQQLLFQLKFPDRDFEVLRMET
ncbi:adenylyl-sulfate kinase [Bacteroidota bacterium]